MAYLETVGKRHTTEVEPVQNNQTTPPGRRLAGRWVSVVVFVTFLGAWELLVEYGVVSALFFPAPTVIVRTLARWLITGEFTPHLRATLSRLFLGFFLGGTAGLLLGLVIGWSQRLREIIDPFIAAIHPIPKISVLPLIMIIFGIGETSKIVVVAVGAFFPMVINTAAAGRQINPLYFAVAQNYGANALKTFRRVVLPGSLPLVLTGTRLALNTSLVITIAVELVTAQQGLGALIWLAWETLRTEELYASLVITSALGISINLLLQALTTWLLPWQLGQ
jgi:NitT/TauT family transport system permease protein